MKQGKSRIDPFYQHRQALKGVFVATATPQSTRVLAKALDYESLEKSLEKKGLAEKPVAIQYLEPKEAICAYRVSLFFETNS